MTPVPYVNPIGHIDQITQDRFGFTFDTRGLPALTVGTQVTRCATAWRPAPSSKCRGP